jgi:hypothetical protein
MKTETKQIGKAREAIVALIQKKKSQPQVAKIPVTVIPPVTRRASR